MFHQTGEPCSSQSECPSGTFIETLAVPVLWPEERLPCSHSALKPSSVEDCWSQGVEVKGVWKLSELSLCRQVHFGVQQSVLIITNDLYCHRSQRVFISVYPASTECWFSLCQNPVYVLLCPVKSWNSDCSQKTAPCTPSSSILHTSLCSQLLPESSLLLHRGQPDLKGIPNAKQAGETHNRGDWLKFTVWAIPIFCMLFLAAWLLSFLWGMSVTSRCITAQWSYRGLLRGPQ